VTFTFARAATSAGHVGSPGESNDVEVTVPALRLDDLFQKHQITDIGLMKMDIEGSEPSALKGLARMLAAHRVNFIYFEVNPACLEQQKTNPLELFHEFTRHGYRLFWPHDSVDWILQTYGAGNATALDLRRFTIHASQAHRVIEFDASRCHTGQFGQCDLLAVSPACRVEREA
jgi:hypothetical protein